MPDVLKIDRFPEHRIWGDCVFLEALTDDAEAVREAYAEASPSWPALHFAVSGPAHEQLDPWCRLGFAQMHAYGVRASCDERFEAPGVSLRLGGRGDLEAALRIDALIEQAQAEPPSYSAYTLDEGEHRETWIETLADAAVTYVVAERDGTPVGHLTLPPDPTDEDALHIASTAVVPEARGTGIGRTLTAFALAHAAERGLRRVRTNWRVTNLAASRFWPARGFETTHIRLFRRLPDL